jgi:hypothetical protein
MQLFALPNLVSKTVTPCTPWTFKGQIPDEVRGKEGKKLRDAWINNPDTAHEVYSGFEGLNGALRISGGKKVSQDEENPPFKLHAFVADIDCPVSQDELAAGLARIKFVPNYYEKTLSGNARLIWLLETPITLPSRKFAVELLDLALVRMRVEQIAPALDKPAWLEPNRYYTNSGDFYVVDATARIGESLLQGWVIEVAEKHHWKKQKNAVAIPLPIVFEAIEKKYPAHNWSGDFIEEAQGPSFWLPGSSSPKSAIVKPTGLFTFSSSAPKAFYGWADLLGIDFVNTYESEMLGQAVKDIYHDGKQYYRNDGYKDWKPFTKEDVQSHLVTSRGINPVKEGDRPSELSRAMEYVRDWQGIVGAAPFVFQPPGVIVRNGNRFLNTHTRKVLTPADAASKALQWGEGFPFLAKYFDGLFDPHEQLEYFLSWLSRFYAGAFSLNLQSGQNVFILGPQNVGKTFLSQGLMWELMGGGAEAESYLLGKSDFNSELFEVAVWSVDDNAATVDAVTHRKFSSITKKMAANTTFQYHAKFRVPCSVDWLGRVFVTANDDEQSARIVPDMSISNREKLFLFRASKTPAVEFPDRRGCKAILRNELPFFARYLLEYQMPAKCRGTSRFGVQHYHEPTLLATAEQSSYSAGFLEIIEDWRETFFGENPSLQYWEGTSFQLLKKLNSDETSSLAGVRNLSANAIGAGLSTLKAKGLPFTCNGDGLTRSWRIPKPDGKKADMLPVSTTLGGLRV